MAQPHVRRWWHQGWSVERWAQEIEQQSAGEHSSPCIVTLDAEEFAYVELYRVRHDRLAQYYAYDDEDRGIHIAIGDGTRIGRGFGREVLRTVADTVLRSEPACMRVVAEPDIENIPSVRAFAAAGFVQHGELQLPDKTAALMVRTRTAQEA